MWKRTYKARTKKSYLNVKECPPKINEVIGYLSMDFAKNNLLERDDLAQDLYLLYFSMLKKRPELVNAQPGYFFIKFKWFLLTKWKKRIKDICKEWDYKLSKLRDYDIPLDPEEHNYYAEQEKEKKLQPKVRLTKKRKRYGF
jgi:hypothetical protein